MLEEEHATQIWGESLPHSCLNNSHAGQSQEDPLHLALANPQKKSLQSCAPLVAVKVGEQVEAAALLAEALLQPVLQQAGQLEVLLADTVALIIFFLNTQVLLAAVHLNRQQHCMLHCCLACSACW